MTEVWTPKTQQAEVWTEAAGDVRRIFAPYIFARKPVFATGTSGGLWDEKTEQPETWVAA